MSGRRTWAARTVAASGLGLALAVGGLMAPAPRLWAQNPQEPAAKPAPGPEIPADPKGAEPPPPPSRTEPEPGPALPISSPPTAPASDPKPATVTPPAPAPPPASADPEAEARAFVERSQKEADAAVAALSKEAETLRARLQKVEAGLARWQAVKESLAASAGPGPAQANRPAWHPRVIEGGVVRTRVEGALRDPEPTILEPLGVPAPDVDPLPKARDAAPPARATEPASKDAPRSSR